MRSLRVLLSSGLFVCACGETSVVPVDAARDAVTDTVMDTGPVLTTRAMTMGPVRLRVGEETTSCVQLDLGNTSPTLLRGARIQLGTASHHVIMYTLENATEQPTPEACSPFGLHGDGAPLMIAQQAVTTLVLPDGVALALAAHQIIRLEMHAINTTGAPVDARAQIEFDTTDEPASRYKLAGLMFLGTSAINIPARSPFTVTAFHSVEGPLAGEEPVKVFALTSHTHHLGVRATIERTTGRLDPGELLHTSTHWDDPPLTQLQQPLVFDGTQGFRLICSYQNNTDMTVTFGESANAEMCFMWAYYYPTHGFIFGL